MTDATSWPVGSARDWKKPADRTEPLALPELDIHFLPDADLSFPDPGDPDVDVWLDLSGELAALGTTIGETHWLHIPPLVSYRFTRNSARVSATAAQHLTSSQVVDCFRRRALPFILHVRGFELFHASAVRAPTGVVAFTARSGTGKSTLAYALHLAGWPQWADDALVFQVRSATATTVALPFGRRLDPAAERTLPRLSLPALARPQQTARASDPLAAVFVLERRTSAIAPHEVVVERLSPAEAFRVLLLHATAFSLRDTERNERMVEEYLELCALVPVYQLSYPDGWSHLAELIAAVRDHVGPAPTAAIPAQRSTRET